MNCYFANQPLLPRACHGRLQAHHVIEQQRLKRRFPQGAVLDDQGFWQPVLRRVGLRPGVRPLRAILDDPRNIVWICDDHHQLVSNRRIYIDVPERVWDFAKDYGLEGMLETDLAKAGTQSTMEG